MPNILDRAIEALAPRAGVKRAAARAALTMHYDGASLSHRTGWRPIGGTSANTEVAMSMERLRNVSRDLARNNPTAANIHQAIPAYVVGAGIVPAIQAQNKKQRETLKTLIAAHLDTPAIDFDGRLNFAGLQALAMRSVVESGEAMVVRYTPPPSLKLPVPLQIRVMEGDYLDSTRNGPMNGNFCFEGIEFDSSGRRVAYWLYDRHPGGEGSASWQMPVSHRVDAKFVLHVFRLDRPGQQRGVPWCAPGIMTMWDLGQYEEAELMRQKIAACFAIFFTGMESGGLGASASANGGRTPGGNVVERVEPGLIQQLPNGAQVTTATPPVMPNLKDFHSIASRKVCLAYGVPYEIGTLDNSQVSFISGRLGRISFNLNVDQWRWHMLIPHMCCGVGDWFLEAAHIARGPFTTNPIINWTAPRRELVSPKDEIPSIRDAIRSGLMPRSEAVRSLGFDPEDVEQEYADENTRADELGLRFDSDGRIPLATKATETVAPVDEDGAADPDAPPPPATTQGK